MRRVGCAFEKKTYEHFIYCTKLCL